MALIRADSRGGLSKRFIGQLLYCEPVRACIYNRCHRGQDDHTHLIQAHHREDAGDDQRGKCADHINFAVREIDEFDNPVHHCIPQGNKGIDAPADQTP